MCICLGNTKGAFPPSESKARRVEERAYSPKQAKERGPGAG